MDSAKLQQLADKQELYELVVRYCRAIDRVDEELLLSCYFADSTQDHGAFKGPIPGLVEHLRKRALDADQGPLQHAVTNCLFDVRGDVAYGETYIRTVMTDADGGALLGFGRYVDRFERRDGEWRIANRRVIIDVPRAGMSHGDFVSGHRDRRDPSYERP